MQRETLTLGITNTTNGEITVSLFGNDANPMDNANATTQYLWDLTTFVGQPTNFVQFQYRGVNQTQFQVASVTYSGTTIADLIKALNSLNIGTFFATTSGISTFVNNYNDKLLFGILYANTNVYGGFVYGSGFNSIITDIAIQPDGKIIVVGLFNIYNTFSVSNGIVRLNQDGSIDNTFNAGTGFVGGAPEVISLQADGKILVGGLFATYNGNFTNNIVRINSDGSFDSSFVIGIGFNNYVYDIKIQSDNKIVCAGVFNNYNLTLANNIIRLNPNGSVDGTFVYGTGFNASVENIEIQSDGKILCVGQFTSYNGTGANNIIRLNSNGSVDGSFVYGTGFNNTVNSLLIQSDGNILIGGLFTNYNGSGVNGLVRLNTNGVIDPTFNSGSGINNTTSRNGLTIQSDGKIIVAGAFTNYNGTSVNFIVRLNPNGSIDNTFGTGASAIVSATDIYNNIIFAGGFFTSFDGISANYIVALI